VDSVGFELYTSMLERSVRELKGEVAPEAVQIDAQLNLGLNVRIPEEYVAEENQRLRMYKRVAAVEGEDQLADVRQELEDRYGAPPEPVLRLLEYAALRLVCRRAGVAAIERRRDSVQVKFAENAAIEPEKLARFVASELGAQFSPAGVLKFSLKSTQPEEVLARLKSLLEELGSAPTGEAHSGKRA
jgi:transcription-repair coupling factor (superfamily II helicase)